MKNTSRNRLAICCCSLFAAGLHFSSSSAFSQLVVPTIGANFNGTNLGQLPGINGGFSYIPPDTMGAIGVNNRFVEFTNGSFAVYNTTNGALIGSRIGQTTFWQNAGVTGLTLNPNTTAGTTDPHVIFDSFTNRWFAVAIDTPNSTATNRFLVAVSATSDPTGIWKGFGITSSATANLFSDFPAIGINNDALYVSTNNFSNITGNGVGTSVLVLPKADLLLAVPTVANRTLFDNGNPNNTGFTPHPVVDMNNGTGSEVLLSDFNTPAGTLKTSRINATNTAIPTFNTAGGFISVAGFAAPAAAHQPGGPNTIDAGDSRFGGNVVEVNNKIWGVQGVTSGGHDALRWVRINATSNVLEESGIIGDALHDYYAGSMAVNATGSIVIGYTRSGDTEVPSSFASVGKFNLVSTTFLPPTLLQAGVGNYNVTFGGPDNRWGDYSQTTINPSDPTDFWTIQEYVSGTNTWSTRITEIRVTDVPEPSTWALLVFGCTGVFARRRTICRH